MDVPGAQLKLLLAVAKGEAVGAAAAAAAGGDGTAPPLAQVVLLMLLLLVLAAGEVVRVLQVVLGPRGLRHPLLLLLSLVVLTMLWWLLSQGPQDWGFFDGVAV